MFLVFLSNFLGYFKLICDEYPSFLSYLVQKFVFNNLYLFVTSISAHMSKTVGRWLEVSHKHFDREQLQL